MAQGSLDIMANQRICGWRLKKQEGISSRRQVRQNHQILKNNPQVITRIIKNASVHRRITRPYRWW